jgi:hypothetical protein
MPPGTGPSDSVCVDIGVGPTLNPTKTLERRPPVGSIGWSGLLPGAQVARSFLKTNPEIPTRTKSTTSFFMRAG